MKATLSFNLDEPDDRSAHKRAVSATDLYIAIHEFDNYLRARLKYEELTEEVADALQKARDSLHNELGDRGVSLGDLD